MALLLATFVVIPMADAVLCASEGGDTYSYVETHSDDSKDKDSDFGHGACSHGHSHHTYDHVPPRSAVEVASLPLAHQWPDSDAIASHTPDGLMRPPKA
ncbi:hypothetical protein B0I24_10547 [Aliidiomarina maris]|nr:hypothetical protein B0I24_10547 [Aliidiomarina maris]